VAGIGGGTEDHQAKRHQYPGHQVADGDDLQNKAINRKEQWADELALWLEPAGNQDGTAALLEQAFYLGAGQLAGLHETRNPLAGYQQGDAARPFLGTRQGGTLLPGDEIEVLGFPAKGEYTPMLEDATYRKIGPGEEPKAVALDLIQILAATNDCRLIQIKARVLECAEGMDVLIVEIGGTVGDIESLPFLEAVRQLRFELGHQNVISVHVTLVPYIAAAGELKTKPTQHSVMKLREIGIQPDILLCRSSKPIGTNLMRHRPAARRRPLKLLRLRRPGMGRSSQRSGRHENVRQRRSVLSWCENSAR